MFKAGTGVMMLKFVFSIRTRNGQKVDNLLISSIDKAGAELKIQQMYRYSEILSCELKQDHGKNTESTSVEEILTLISR